MRSFVIVTFALLSFPATFWPSDDNICDACKYMVKDIKISIDIGDPEDLIKASLIEVNFHEEVLPNKSEFNEDLLSVRSAAVQNLNMS